MFKSTGISLALPRALALALALTLGCGPKAPETVVVALEDDIVSLDPPRPGR